MIRYLSLDPEVPAHDYWDQTLLDDLLTDTDKDVIVIPGARQAHLVDDISMEIAQYPNPTVIITSDEENNFPVGELYHPNMVLYVTYPNKEKHQNVDGFLPIGYAPRTRELAKATNAPKDLDWFFAGQDTHPARHECIQALQDVPNGKLVSTGGFAQGLDYEEYMQYMCRAKVVPCPGGPFSPDSFRLYEALEAGCVPIVTNREFWTLLFGEEPPFPIMQDWTTLPAFIENTRDRYPAFNNECQAWWIKKKQELKWKLH